ETAGVATAVIAVRAPKSSRPPTLASEIPNVIKPSPAIRSGHAAGALGYRRIVAKSVSAARGPGVIVARHARPFTANGDGARRAIGLRGTGLVGASPLLPFARLVGLVGGRYVGAVMHPAMP